ncbi:DUF3331 domain-containing protein [Burkholderia sp. MR1-5-21]
MNAFNRWERMVTDLCPPPDAGRRMLPHGRDASSSRASRAAAPVPSSGRSHSRTSIVAVERQTDSSVLVSWSDPTRCRYDEQRWISAKSRLRGCCALSGQVIHTGDAIYKPQWRGGKRPANCTEMILATELDRLVVRMTPP